MAKLITMFLILLAIQACLILYTKQDPEETSIWNFVTNIDNWTSLNFVLAIVGIAAGIGGIVAAAGAFGFKTDFLIFAPAIAGFISMGIVFTNLAKVIGSELTSILPYCDLYTSGGYCPPVVFILAITIAPVAFYYVWTIVEWWRGKDY